MGKLLNILGVPESVQENLPPEIFQGEQMINVMQTVYESAPESNKKISLANAISESVRLLLLEIEKYKSGIQTQPEQPKIKEQEELPFKIGDKFCMKTSKYPYLIESIDIPNGNVSISGFNNAGEPKKQDFEIKWIVSKIKEGVLYPCPEKKPRKTKTTTTKPTKPEQPKPEQPKPEQPKPQPKTQPKPQPKTQPKPEQPKPKIHDAETTKKIREIQEQIDEINDTLVAFDEGTEDYQELMSEVNKLNKQIKDLKK